MIADADSKADGGKKKKKKSGEKAESAADDEDGAAELADSAASKKKKKKRREGDDAAPAAPKERESGKAKKGKKKKGDAGGGSSRTAQRCNAIFIEPMLWMQVRELAGNDSGKINCPQVRARAVGGGWQRLTAPPQCFARLGTWAWNGENCECGQKVEPAFKITRTKVEKVK